VRPKTTVGVADAFDLQPQVRGVRTAARFGERNRAQGLTLNQLVEPRAHDRGLPVLRQDLAVQRREQVDVADAEVGTRDLLVDHARGQTTESLAPEIRRQFGRDEAERAHRLHERAIEHARAVPLLISGRDAPGGETARVLGQRHQVGVEIGVHGAGPCMRNRIMPAA
jgi:hypothetical protein